MTPQENNPIIHLKLLVKQEQGKPKNSGWKDKYHGRKITVQRTNETKCWFFEKINNSNKPLAKLIKTKRGKMPISKIKDEKRDIITNTTKSEDH